MWFGSGRPVDSVHEVHGQLFVLGDSGGNLAKAPPDLAYAPPDAPAVATYFANLIAMSLVSFGLRSKEPVAMPPSIDTLQA